MSKLFTKLSAAKNKKLEDAMCAKFGYQETVDVDGLMQPNTETKEDFSDRMIKELIANEVRNYEAGKAKQEAIKSLTPFEL